MKNKMISALCYIVITILYCQNTFSVKKDSDLDLCNIDKVIIATGEKAVIMTGAFQHDEFYEEFTRTTDTMGRAKERGNMSNIVTETPDTTDEPEMSTSFGFTNATTDKNPVTFSHVENNKVQDLIAANCNIDIIATTAKSIKVDVSFIYSHPVFSYLYIENLAGGNEQCPKKFALFSHTTNACRLLVETNISRLHLRDAYVRAEVTTSNYSSHPECHTNTEGSNKSLDGNNVPWCDLFLFNNVKEMYPLDFKNSFAFDLACAENCSCVLGFRKFTSTCRHGQNKILSETLLIYTRGIEKLWFSNVGLSDISEGAFFGLNALTHLYIYGNQLFYISKDTLAGLEELIYLNLNYNQIVNLHNDTFDLLLHLKFLSVQFNGLKSLEFGVFSRLIHLQELYLRWNNLKKLPEMCFSNLYKLTHLELKHNSIDILPPNSFHDLHLLQNVHLQFNQITQVPYGLFEGLSELRAIYLHSNRLISIPAGLFNGLNKLRYLSLSDNKLSTLPVAIFDDLNNLILLHLEKNLLTTLSSNVFTYLSKLTLLFIQDNQLYSLPSNLLLHTNSLNELDLRNNQIVSLPESIFDTLDKLKTFI